MIDNKEQLITLECNKCSYKSSMKSVEIYDAEVNCRGETLVLTFFICPRCKTIYRVNLKDALYMKLKADLDRAKEKMRKLRGSGKLDRIKAQNDSLLKKQERLRKHAQKLNDKYSGTFTFAASENNDKGVAIIYHE